ncbi:MAG: hypothetical protein ACI33N_07810 [Desulfovibrionaceae bacterium]
MREDFVCEDCGQTFLLNLLTETEDGLICEQCINHYAHCEDCGTYHHEDDLTLVRNANGINICVCESCIEQHYVQCNDCGEIIHHDFAMSLDDGNFLCESCSSNYFQCEECGRLLYEDEYYSDGICRDCFREQEKESEVIHSYGYKPTPCFKRGIGEKATKRLYMGIELEYLFPDFSDRNEAAEEWDEKTDFFYLKEDGSLDCGFEAVSHPLTLKAWQENYLLMEKLLGVAEEYSAYTTHGTGLHIHLSKKGMSEAHKLRLNVFINKYMENILPIARRSPTSWAKFKGIELSHIRESTIQHDRYEALNWYNASTVEFRFFKSTLKTLDLYAALEFVHASYSFTKSYISISALMLNPDETWQSFLAFINARKEYEDLSDFIKLL